MSIFGQYLFLILLLAYAVRIVHEGLFKQRFLR
jgi:hypothetical protein